MRPGSIATAHKTASFYALGVSGIPCSRNWSTAGNPAWILSLRGTHFAYPSYCAENWEFLRLCKETIWLSTAIRTIQSNGGLDLQTNR